MIIKKNQAKINKNIKVEPQIPDKSQEIEPANPQEEEQSREVTLEEIAFEQREERREGSRRRGYRRTNDRMILTRAQEEAVKIKSDAWSEGYKKGIEEAQKQLDELNKAIQEYYNYKGFVVDSISQSVYDIALEIAQKILKKEINSDDSAMLNMIKSILSDINRHENRITLKVRPDDVNGIKKHFDELFPEGLFEGKVSVLGDKNIQDGGVIVETSNGIVDARIETQIEILKNAFKT